MKSLAYLSVKYAQEENWPSQTFGLLDSLSTHIILQAISNTYHLVK